MAVVIPHEVALCNRSCSHCSQRASLLGTRSAGRRAGASGRRGREGGRRCVRKEQRGAASASSSAAWVKASSGAQAVPPPDALDSWSSRAVTAASSQKRSHQLPTLKLNRQSCDSRSNQPAGPGHCALALFSWDVAARTRTSRDRSASLCKPHGDKAGVDLEPSPT